MDDKKNALLKKYRRRQLLIRMLPFAALLILLIVFCGVVMRVLCCLSWQQGQLLSIPLDPLISVWALRLCSLQLLVSWPITQQEASP